MLVGGVAQHHIEHDAHTALAGRGNKLVKILHGAVPRIDGAIVRHVIAVVALRQGVNGVSHKSVDAKVCQIVELGGDAGADSAPGRSPSLSQKALRRRSRTQTLSISTERSSYSLSRPCLCPYEQQGKANGSGIAARLLAARDRGLAHHGVLAGHELQVLRAAHGAHHHRGRSGMTRGGDLFGVEGEQDIAHLDMIALGDVAGKAIALHIDCVDAHMDEQLHAVCERQPHGTGWMRAW